MKILKLEIHNLASIQHAEVDFTAEPLSGEPLFLICGPTGAGKTTILDAICLALYDDTPRFTNANENGVHFYDSFNAAKGKNGKTDMREAELPLDHKGQLLRRGCYEAWVKLTFEAYDQKYIAQWSVARSNQRADGKLNTPKRSLENLDTHQVWERKKDVDGQVESLVGLTFNEFCRTTMLAQGQFARFLQCKSDEKSAILETLTHTEKYTHIGQRIFYLYKDREDELKLAEAKLAGFQPLTDEEQTARNNEIAQLKAEKERYAQEKNRLNVACEWLKAVRENQVIHDDAKRMLDMQLRQTETPEYLAETADIEDYAATEIPRTLRKDIEEASTTLRGLREKKKEYLAYYWQLVEACERIGDIQLQEKEKQETLHRWIEEREAYAGMYDLVESIMATLRHVRAEEESGRRKSQLKNAAEQKLPKAKAAIEEAEKTENEAREVLEKCEKTLQTHATERDALKPDEVQMLIEQTGKQLKAVQEVMSAADRLEDARRNLETAEESHKEQHQKLTELEERKPELESTFQAAETQYEEGQLIFNQWKDALDDSFKIVRASLRKGQLCPLCLQTVEHEHVPDPDFEELLQPIIQRQKEGEEKVNQARAALEINKELIKKVQEDLLKSTANLREAEKKFNQWLQKVRKGWLEVERTAPDSCGRITAGGEGEWLPQVTPLREWLGSVKQTVEEIQGEAKGKWMQVMALNRKIEDINKEKDRLSMQRLNAQRATGNARKKYELLVSDIDNYGKQVKEHQKNVRQDLLALADKIAYPLWETEWEADHDAFTKRLADDTAAYVQRRKEMERLAKQTEKREVFIKGIETARKDVERVTLFGREERMAVKKTEMTDERAFESWQELLAAMTRWMTQQQQTATFIKEKDAQLMQFHEDHPRLSIERLEGLMALTEKTVQQLKKKHQEQESGIERTRGQVFHLEQEAEKLQKHKPQMDEEATEQQLQQDMAQLDEASEACSTRIGLLTGELEENKKTLLQLSEAIKERDRIKEEHDRWKEFCDMFGSKDGKKFRKIAQSFILNHLLQKANVFLRQFTDRYELACVPGEITILVRDRFTHMKPQYISVLSGGESFMVSLSLALALAHLNTSNTGADIIFIDEGFGTLDEDYLNAVIDTLERLHQMEGRRVGLISHVEQLKSKIVTQIQVARIDPSRSQVKVTRN